MVAHDTYPVHTPLASAASGATTVLITEMVIIVTLTK